MEMDAKELWGMYFNGEEMVEQDPREPVVQAILEHYCSAGEDAIIQLAAELQRETCIAVDVPTAEKVFPIESFKLILRNEPITLISCICLGIHMALKSRGLSPPGDIVRVRMYNFGKPIPLSQLKSSVVERFVCIRGTVVRASSIQPLVTELSFVCSRCDAIVNRRFSEGRYEPPTSCPTAKCKNRQLGPDRSTAKAIDFQTIRLQESLHTRGEDPSHVPRTINVELTNDLVDKCVPGDVVEICGTVKAVRTDVRSSGSKQTTCLYVLFVDANSICNDRIAKTSPGTLQSELSKCFTLQELHAVQAIHASENLFSLLVNSLCPGIFGHEVVKAGLCLGIFGGCRKNTGTTHHIPVRGDIHILVVGDPGLGKSQMLRSVVTAAPRAVYVCGNSTTTAGLTVALSKESGGDYALEAGALVLADDGVCCIDEMDKMSADYQALLEAMEQQNISIAKAGMVCTLSARTSVVAAANPVGGHYNRAKTVNENLKMSTALLSRFDLIFILLDNPDSSRDELISEQVIKMHSGDSSSRAGRSSIASESPANGFAPLTQRQRMAPPEWQSERPMIDRLKMTERDRTRFEPIPHFLLRRYVAYAKQYVRPRLSPEAKHVLKNFYLNLRKNHHQADGTPVTTRQLESLIRMAEARARMELRELVTERDARDVVDIMQDSLFDIYADECGQIDVGRSHGTSKSKQSAHFVKAMHVASRQRESSIFTIQELYDISERAKIQVDDFHQFIDTLNHQGVLLKKGRKRYQLVASSFD